MAPSIVRRLAQFTAGKLTRGQLLSGFSRLPEREAREVLSAIDRDPALSALLHGPLKIAAEDELTPQALGPSMSLEDEIAWLFAGLRQYRELTRRVLELQSDFYKALEVGDSTIAADALACIRTEFGFSLFSFSNSSRIAAMAGGKPNAIKPRSLLAFIAHHAASRSDLAETVQNYRDRLATAYEVGAIPQKQRKRVEKFFEFVVGVSELDELTQDEAAFIVRQFTSFPLFDRVDLLLRLAVTLTVVPSEWARAVVRRVSIRLKEMHPSEPRAVAISELNAGELERYRIDEAVLRVIEDYTLGHYQDVLSKTAALPQSSRHLELVEVVWRAHQRSGERIPESLLDQSPFGRCIEILRQRAAGGESVLQAENAFEKLQLLFKDTPLWFRLRLLVAPLLGINLPDERRRLAMMGRALLSPRSAMELGPMSEELSRSLSSAAPATSLIFQSRTPNDEPGQIALGDLPPARREKYLGVRCELRGQHAQALSHYEAQLREESDLEGQRTATSGILRQLLRCGELARAARQAASWGIADPALVDKSDLANVFDCGEKLRGPHRTEIAWPILSALVYGRVSRQAAQNPIYRAIADVVDHFSVARPSELLDIPDVTASTSSSLLASFCATVCTIDNIDSLVGIRSTKELLEERSRLLESAVLLEGAMLGKVSRELADIQQSLHTQELVTRADRGRVVADIAGMAAKIDRATRILCNAYLSIAGLDQSIECYIINVGDQSSPLRKFEYRTYESLLTRILNVVRDIFVADTEFGVDSYLSVQIRHGSLVEQLRGPFERNLIGRGSALARLEVDEHLKANIVGESKRLASDVTKTLEEVRVEWIQFRSRPDDPEAHLFDFALSDSDIGEIHETIARSAPDTPELISRLFEYFTQRLELNLQKVRATLRDKLRTSLHGMVEGFELTLARSFGGSLPADIQGAVDQCKSEIDVSIEIVSTWFEIEDTRTKQSFQLDAAVEASVECARRLDVTPEI